jgi:hypothetical protein
MERGSGLAAIQSLSRSAQQYTTVLRMEFTAFLHAVVDSRPQGLVKLINAAEKDRLPRIPREQAEDESATRTHDPFTQTVARVVGDRLNISPSLFREIFLSFAWHDVTFAPGTIHPRRERLPSTRETRTVTS